METLAVLYRCAQLYAHRAHNVCRGETFFPDHDFLGGIYEAYEGAYDNVVERMIGLGMKPAIVKITSEACKKFEDMASDSMVQTDTMLAKILGLEKEFCSQIEEAMKGELSQGTQNMLQGLCDESEVRQYKLKQRLAK